MIDESVIESLAFGELTNELRHFANHTHKLVRASQKHRALLEEASRFSGGKAPLDKAPESPWKAMQTMDAFARSQGEDPLHVFGAYFAHHHLRDQAEMAMELFRERTNVDPEQRIATCHRIYEQAEMLRREWVSSLLHLTIGVAASDLSRKDYAAFNVGALTDHEDVDLAIVVSSVRAQQAMNAALATVTKTFLKYASKIQLFLTEELQTARSGALISEIEEVLRRPTQRVVSVMQLLGAQYLCGNPALARSLEDRVTRQCYAGQGNPIVHEGFLRAVMAELRHYLQPQNKPGTLSPKSEVYVPAKLATSAIRVIHGVQAVSVPYALRMLATKDSEHHEDYMTLADAFVQNEVLRSLMFLYVVPGNVFDLNEPYIRDASHRVAQLLGLGKSARRSPENRLSGAYSDIRTRAIRSVSRLSNKIEQHLERVSTFRRLVEAHSRTAAPSDNLVLLLLRSLKSYRGSVFWEEVIKLLNTQRNQERFLADFEKLGDNKYRAITGEYIDMMCEHAACLVEFLILLAPQEPPAAASHEFAANGLQPTSRDSKGGASGSPQSAIEKRNELWQSLMDYVSSNDTALTSLIEGLDANTSNEALFRLASAYTPSQLAALADLIENHDPSTRGSRVTRNIRAVIVLVHHRSNAIGRMTDRVLSRAPQFLKTLGDERSLKELAAKIRTRAAEEPIPQRQVKLIGHAFDVVALSAALVAILEGAPAERDAQFTDAVDQYVRDLFKACFREVRQGSPMLSSYRPGTGIALFATGGYGRGEAFGGDWDYFAVTSEHDRGLKKFFGKVLQRLSSALTRHGLLPHNRFAVHFNAYVASIPELSTHLSERTDETFIDEAEVLEARFLIGDPSVAKRFDEEIRHRLYTTNRIPFIRDILNELNDRRSIPPRNLDLKSAPGGLREIHLMWLAIRTFAKLPGPLTPDLLPAASEALPMCQSDIRFLLVAAAELRRSRDLYRLLVAFSDNFDPLALALAAEDLAPIREAGIHRELGRDLEKMLKISTERIDRVAHTMTEQIGT